MPEQLYDKYFETRFPNFKYRDKMWRPVARYLQEKYIPEDSVILDLGAGYCNFINHVIGKERHASDISNIIKKYAEPGVITHIQNCTNLNDMPDNKFDIVFESNLLEHLELNDVEKTLTEVRRVLKPGGRFIAMQPNFIYLCRNYFNDYTHRQVFDHISFPDLLSNYGFEVEKIEPKFLPATFKQRLPRIPFLVKLYLRSPWRPGGKQMLAVSKKPHVQN